MTGYFCTNPSPHDATPAKAGVWPRGVRRAHIPPAGGKCRTPAFAGVALVEGV